MVRVLVWGAGEEYNKHVNCLKLLELTGQIEVAAVVSNDIYIKDKIDGYRFIHKDEINLAEFDCCLIAVEKMKPVVEEAKKYGIAEEKCMPIRVTAIPGFQIDEYIKLKKSNISLFSINCWAGLCYHYLGLPFLSPTINMFLSYADFNKMMMNLDYYMSLPVEWVKDGIETGSGTYFPIGRIGDVELDFLHYETFEEAANAWNKRKLRINKENIFVLSYTENKDELYAFEDIPYEHKVIFTSCREKSPSSIYLDNSPWGEMWKPVIATARGSVNLIDMIALLNHRKDYFRV